MKMYVYVFKAVCRPVSCVWRAVVTRGLLAADVAPDVKPQRIPALPDITDLHGKQDFYSVRAVLISTSTF